MLPSEFIAELRDSAIRNGAAPAVIDQIDALGDVEDLKRELEKAGEETYQAEQDRNNLRKELAALLATLATQEFVVDNNKLMPAFKVALNALERHGEPANSLARLTRDLAL